MIGSYKRVGIDWEIKNLDSLKSKRERKNSHKQAVDINSKHPPDDDGNADENSVEVFGNVKIAEAGDNNFPGNNYPDMEDSPVRTPCDDLS